MFQLSSDTLKTMGAEITTREIKQEPELWQETFDNYLKEKEEISSFLKKIIESANSKKLKLFLLELEHLNMLEILFVLIFKPMGIEEIIYSIVLHQLT